MQLDRSVSEGQDELRNTSFLERTTIYKSNRGLDLVSKSFFTTDVYLDIEKDEAELEMKADSLKPVL
jgi:hypothetical protein